MAIDSTLFTGQIPAGTYAVGDIISMNVIRGPAVVRDGYGEAILKRIFSITNGSQVGHVVIKNSNWVDEVDNIAPSPSQAVLATNSNGIQSGHDARLQPNSGWSVYFEFDSAVTTTTAGDVFAIIDVDYPKVQAIANPKNAQGLPCSTIRRDAYSVTAAGSSNALVWTTYNVDILKAGYRYLLSSTAYRAGPIANAPTVGFFSISGAAGQSGLERIIPVLPNSISNLRYDIDYSTPLVKGPFNINYAAVGSTALTDTATLEIDWVKK